MIPELGIFADIQAAFAIDTITLKLHYGNIIETEEIDVLSGPQYWLAIHNMDDDSDLSQESHDIIPGFNCTLVTIDKKASEAVNNSVSLIKKIHCTPNGNIGPGDRPVVYNGVHFYEFKPKNGIKLSATEFNGNWIVEQDIYVVAKKII